MIRTPRLALLALAAAAVIAGGTACRKPPPETKPAQPETPAVTPPPAPAPVTVPEEPFSPPEKPAAVEVEAMDDLMRRQNEGHEFLKTVYFDFDEAGLRDDAIATLKANAAWLRAHPKVKVVVQGHCDERGTIEYNLELGDRRARSVMEYLQSLGSAGVQIRAMTFGEEKPADPGHSESAWALNRRAEFFLE